MFKWGMTVFGSETGICDFDVCLLYEKKYNMHVKFDVYNSNVFGLGAKQIS